MYGFAVETNAQPMSAETHRSNDVPSNFIIKLASDVALVALLPVIVAVDAASEEILHASQLFRELGVLIS